MKIAALFYLAPRKLGSLEQWVLTFLEECGRRGHTVHLFWARPLHPVVERRLAELGVDWTEFRELEESPLRWGRRMRASFDVVYMNLVVPRSRGALAAYLAWPLPVLLFDGISGDLPGKRRRVPLGPLLDPLVSRRLTSLAGCSEYVVQRNMRRFGLPAGRCPVIYNGIDTRRFVPSRRVGGRPPVIAAVARLIPEKGIDVLLRACVLIQDLPWELRIVGHGAEEDNLKALAASLGLGNRVEFLGLRDNVEETLQAADVKVHPCLWEEAFGLTIAEAMAAGCATIASRIGGIPEIIDDGVHGLLVTPGNAEELAAAMRRVLANPDLRAELAQAGRRRVLERFDLGPAVTKQVDWIEEIVTSATSSNGHWA